MVQNDLKKAPSLTFFADFMMDGQNTQTYNPRNSFFIASKKQEEGLYRKAEAGIEKVVGCCM
jgi:hypothetical protein